MKTLRIVFATLLLTLCVAEAVPPTGTVYRIVQIDTNGVLVNAGTNLVARNGIATTGSVAAAMGQAQLGATNVTGLLTFTDRIIGLTAAAVSNAMAGVYALVDHFHGSSAITNAPWLTGEADTNALAQLGAHSNRTAYAGHPGTGSASTNETGDFATAAQGDLADTSWKNPANATNWGWTSNGEEITLTTFRGSGEIIVPDTLDGLPVCHIPEGFLSQVSSFLGMTNIVLGANLKSIGRLVFGECVQFPGPLILPNGLTNIGESAFFDWQNNVADLTIPASVQYIGPDAFSTWVRLTNVYFKGNAPLHGANVFSSSTNVTKVYATDPTSTGWSNTWDGLAVVRLPLYGSGAALTGFTPSQIGAVWRTNTVISAIYTNESGAVTGIVENTLIYLGQP